MHEILVRLWACAIGGWLLLALVAFVFDRRDKRRLAQEIEEIQREHAQGEPVSTQSAPGYQVISRPGAAIFVEERITTPEERRQYDIGNLDLGGRR